MNNLIFAWRIAKQWARLLFFLTVLSWPIVFLVTNAFGFGFPFWLVTTIVWMTFCIGTIVIAMSLDELERP
jgi:hypothetical protein